MGGCAHIIHGQVTQEALDPTPRKRSFLDRLLGRNKFEGIRRTDFGDSTLIEVPCRGLSEEIDSSFKSYLGKRLPEPTEATSTILDYLNIGVVQVYVRGEETTEGCEWYTQITFSGCAGMADVSAEVCAHWAAIWATDEFGTTIQPMLRRYGFEARVRERGTESEGCFICVEVDKTMHYASTGFEGEPELDGAIYAGLSEDYESFRARIGKQYSDQISAGSCFCQMCSAEA